MGKNQYQYFSGLRDSLMHLTHICPRFKEIHGGGEPVLLHLFHYLSDMGVKNTVITYNYPVSMLSLLDDRVELKELPTFVNRSFDNPLVAGFYDMFCTILFLNNIPKETEAICFHTENVVPALFFYKLFGGKKPNLYFCFQPPRFAYDTTKETANAGGMMRLFMPLFKIFYRPFDKAAVTKADRVATFSNGYKRWIEEIYDVQDVSVIPPGVEKPERMTSNLPEAIAQRLAMPDIKTLICVGKLVNWKNVDRLISITSIIKRKIPNIRLLVVGDGPCMASLKNQTATMGLDENVIFCGYVSAENVFSFLAASDLLVLLEKNASFGLSLIEANAVGLPVMAFEGGGPSDIINDGKNGFLLPSDMPDDEIAESITRYMTNPNTITNMKKHSLSEAEQYTWRGFAEMFATLMEGICGQ
jgi:glycosyltransferase involved in cell wall biosynthesis